MKFLKLATLAIAAFNGAQSAIVTRGRGSEILIIAATAYSEELLRAIYNSGIDNPGTPLAAEYGSAVMNLLRARFGGFVRVCQYAGTRYHTLRPQPDGRVTLAVVIVCDNVGNIFNVIVDFARRNFKHIDPEHQLLHELLGGAEEMDIAAAEAIIYGTTNTTAIEEFLNQPRQAKDLGGRSETCENHVFHHKPPLRPTPTNPLFDHCASCNNVPLILNCPI